MVSDLETEKIILPMFSPIGEEEALAWRVYCHELEKILKTFENLELFVWVKMANKEIENRKERGICEI